MMSKRTKPRPETVGLVALSFALAATATACFRSPEAQQQQAVQELEPRKPIENSPPLPAGSYDVQTVTYDDATGLYKLFVLGAPAGHKPSYQTTELMMARITDEAIAAGKKSYVEFKQGEPPVLHLTPEFQISYVHNVTEEHVDPRTQQRETVIVAQHTSSWSPFMSAMAGAMIGNMLFSPHYYYPPPYAAGGMVGYGGVGQTRSIASQQYAQKFGTQPNADRLSKTGMSPRRVNPASLKSSGSGAGSSRMKPNAKPQRPARRGFGFGRRR